MIRTNLSTRPFYNERVVRLWLLAFAALVVAASVFNVTRVIHYSRSDTELATQASRDEARAAELRTAAAQLRASVDLKQIDFASSEARQANDLIDRRTFSWTELFNRFEATLPEDVRITSVRPKLEKRGFIMTIVVVARDATESSSGNLERTGVFADLLVSEEHFNEQGQLDATLNTMYLPARRSS
jgi:hypothetical protein